MKKTWMLAGAFVYSAGLFLAGPALAAPGDVGSLDAPTGLTCTAEADYFDLGWDGVTDAEKYSVDITCTMDDGLVVAIYEYDVNTADREDEGYATVPNLDVTYASLEEMALLEPGALAGFSCVIKVKAMNAGKNHGRQNHRFSDEVECDIP